MIREIVRGLGVTLRTTFGPPVTVSYPEARRQLADRFMGRHVLKRYSNGLERCIGCALCAAACPADAILVVPAGNGESERYSPGERYARIFEINMVRCIFCGFCAEACPVDAIVLEHEFELADCDRDAFIYTKDRLLEPPRAGVSGTPQDSRRRPVAFSLGGTDYFLATPEPQPGFDQ